MDLCIMHNKMSSYIANKFFVGILRKCWVCSIQWNLFMYEYWNIRWFNIHVFLIQVFKIPNRGIIIICGPYIK